MKKYLLREKTRLILEKFRAVVPCKIQQISTFHPQLFTICSTNEAENLYNTRLGGKFWRNSTFSNSSQITIHLDCQWKWNREGGQANAQITRNSNSNSIKRTISIIYSANKHPKKEKLCSECDQSVSTLIAERTSTLENIFTRSLFSFVSLDSDTRALQKNVTLKKVLRRKNH